MKIIYCTLFFFISISCLAQTIGKIDKPRFEFLMDSLSTKKASLILEKENLITSIDSLNKYIVSLNEKWESSRANQLIKKYGRENGLRINRGQVWKGMSEKMLEDSWGKPDKITKNKEKWGLFSQWYFGEITYFFKNGELIGWEEK